MKNVQLTMNVAKQRQKLASLLDPCDRADKQEYVLHLLGLFDRSVADGQPQPASQFIPMYQEEFGC